MNIGIICETAYPPFDEGIRKYAFKLGETFAKQGHHVCNISRVKNWNTAKKYIKTDTIPKNKFFLSYNFFRKIKKMDLVIYIPSSSETVPSFIRYKLISIFASSSALILMQPNLTSLLRKSVIRFLRPQNLYTLSVSLKRKYEKNRLKVKIINAGVDINKFQPVKEEKREMLRRKWNLPVNKILLLHIGHISSNRNLGILTNLPSKYKVTILESTSYKDRKNIELEKKLKEAGIIIKSEYIENIEEFYQAADLYIFPVINSKGAIGFPLTVIEAMACNIPVLSTPFGLLPTVVHENNGVRFFNNKNEMLKLLDSDINNFMKNNPRDYIKKKFTWKKIAEKLEADLFG